ncbi:capsular exopolysaccharide family protein [Synechococcus sp. PCC 7335]|nr:capsular exopolysaccharide family protein [Synechococcus sp. PCC 7335]
MRDKEYTEEIDLQKYWCVLRRRWRLATFVFSSSICLTVLALASQEAEYEATGKLLIKGGRTSSLTGLNVDIGELEALDSLQKDPLRTQAEIIQSLPTLEKAIATAEAAVIEEALTPTSLKEGLEVKAIPGTDILEISYQSPDDQTAPVIVNALMEAYIENNVETNREEAIAARRFIAGQLPQTESAVSAAEANLRQFKEENGVVDLEQEAAQAVDSIGNLDTQIDQAKTELANVNARLLELRRQLGMELETAIELNTLSQSPGVQEVLTELQAVQSQLAIEQARYQSTHPAVLNLQRQVNSLESLLRQRIRTVTTNGRQQFENSNMQLGELQQSLIELYLQLEVDRVGLSQRVSELSDLQGVYRRRASTLPALEKTQRELERRLQASQTTYEALLTKLQEVQVAENQNVGNARVVEAAIAPESPVDSRRELILIAGILAGSLVGISAAFAQDLLDRSIKTLNDCREQFGYALLGAIPLFNETSNLHRSKSHSKQLASSVFSNVRTRSRNVHASVVTEAYQMLWSNLKSVTSRQELKTIVITSAAAGEGKSEVSVNLATTIAQSGQRVLLIDADMRHPSLHKTWNISNRVGLSSFLVGQSSAQDTIQSVMPRLHVLPSGWISSNPVDLLDASSMERLIAELSEYYDFIILDSSPFVGCADPSILGKVADGVVLVVRPGVLNAKAANAAREHLMSTEQRVVGMVVNALDVKNDPDSYFYSTYYTRVDEINSRDRSVVPDTVVSNQGIFRL